MTTKPAFTLIEILVAVMLTGLLSALALAPVAATIARTQELRQDYSDGAAMAKTAEFITRDLFQAVRLASNVVTITDHEALGGWADDTLLIMTSSTSAADLPSATVVYRIDDGGFMHSRVIPGLYRWVIPARLPNEINVERLEAEKAQLVLPYVSDFSVEVPGRRGEDLRSSYAGALPAGIVLKLARGVRDNFSASREDNKHVYQQYIALP